MIPVLFVRKDSVYKTLPCDPWDADRDARQWPGGLPAVYHPPCAQWSCLRGLARDIPKQKALGPWAVGMVRAYGGVLEHPDRSSLFAYCGIPTNGDKDVHGGFTLSVDQFWFGLPARKWTWLYIVGLEKSDIPQFSMSLSMPSRVISTSRGGRHAPEIGKSKRDITVLAFARFLLEIASRCRR